MIPSPDFRLDISITIAEEVIKIGSAAVVCSIAIWGVVKMTQILFGKSTQQSKVKE
jgi:hypothetical protein